MKSGPVLTNNKWLTLDDELVTRYNQWDCYNTARLIPKTKSLLAKAQNTEFFDRAFWPLVPAIQAMQARGVGELDNKARNRLRHDLRTQVAELEKGILDGTNTTSFTDKLFNSPKQLAKLLFDDWGLPSAPPTRKRRSRSTDLASLAWTLGHLRKRDEPYRLRLHDLFHRSRIQTILERYLVIEGDVDGRVRPTIKITGTETGRLAIAGGPGEAIHQWPPEIRHLIKARPGCVFVGRDHSQLEARILAVLSQDSVSLAAFAEGRDVHAQNCRDLFGLSEAEYEALSPTNTVAFRLYAKTFLYGFSYGAKADSIKMKLFCPCWRCASKAPPQVNLTVAEVKRAADRWAQAHWAVMDWRTKLIESVYGFGQDRIYRSPFGWNMRLWEPRDKGERSLMNKPMQHAASQIINRAMVELHNLGCPLVLQMHDELVAEVPEADAPYWDYQMKTLMEQAIPELDNTIFPTTGHIGVTWADLK